jgi:hypothetical protein
MAHWLFQQHYTVLSLTSIMSQVRERTVYCVQVVRNTISLSLTHNNLGFRGGKWDVRQNFALKALSVKKLKIKLFYRLSF